MIRQSVRVGRESEYSCVSYFIRKIDVVIDVNRNCDEFTYTIASFPPPPREFWTIMRFYSHQFEMTSRWPDPTKPVVYLHFRRKN